MFIFRLLLKVGDLLSPTLHSSNTFSPEERKKERKKDKFIQTMKQNTFICKDFLKNQMETQAAKFWSIMPPFFLLSLCITIKIETEGITNKENYFGVLQRAIDNILFQKGTKGKA